MRTAFWDLECSDLQSDFGVLLSAAIKPYGKKPILLYQGRRGSDDRTLAKIVRDELEKYDILVSHYGLGFDLKFLNSRLMHWGMKRLSPKLHIDTYRLARRGLNIHSRRLESICDFVGVKGKTRVDPEIWQKAAYDGDKYALAKIVSHNKWDVIILEEVFEKGLKQFIRGISIA